MSRFSLLLAMVAVGATGCGGQFKPPTNTRPLVALKGTGISQVQTNGTWNTVADGATLQQGAMVRTGTNSFLAMTSLVSPHRIVLNESSEMWLDRWIPSETEPAGMEEIQLSVRNGMAVIDVPVLNGASKFEVKGSNFVAGVRSGTTIAAISAEGSVLVQSGTIVCVFVMPTVKAVTLNAGQMVDPKEMKAKTIPAESNGVWNLLSK